jgi:hypothetical protein
MLINEKIVFGHFWMIYMLDYNLFVWSNFDFNSVNHYILIVLKEYNLSIRDKKFQTHEGIISIFS